LRGYQRKRRKEWNVQIWDTVKFEKKCRSSLQQTKEKGMLKFSSLTLKAVIRWLEEVEG